MKMQRFSIILLVLVSGRAFLHTAIAQNHTQGSIEKLKNVLKEPRPGKEQLASRDAQAKRQSQAAIELLILGQNKEVWPLLKQSNDPGLRSYLIRDIGSSGVS